MWAEDFGAVGDGITDDTSALTAFWNDAMANPGVPYRMRARRYKITAALPTINVSNVWIEGAGAEIHDTGTLVTGTVLVWGGSSSPTTRVCSISAVSGASNQRVANVTFKGIGIDCNSGTVGYGLEILSVQKSTINVAIANASDRAVNISVVPSLGEARDTQRNFIRIQGRQIEAPGGCVLVISGDTGANTSFNEIEVDCQHRNIQAIYCNNSDNNDWRLVRCFKVGDGLATECVSLNGSNAFARNSRAERFHVFTANTPLHAYGTGFIYPSISNTIFCIDGENGTPAPIIDDGASVHWRYDQSGLNEDDWIEYMPAISSLTGTLSNVTGVVGSYRKLGKRAEFKVQFQITSNGTGGSALAATLPIAALAGLSGDMCVGKERAVTGKAFTGFIDGGATTVVMQNFDGSYPGINGGAFTLSGEYQVGS